jgi:hypothetical protein
MIRKMPGKRKVGRPPMGWIEDLKSSMQTNVVELEQETETHGKL